jgi:BirA family biotin operon repressor/biotin-[acetyl-CoA-carboxylase] ligase
MPVQPIRWPLEAIWEAVAPDLEGFTAEALPSIDSTNSELMRRFKGASGIAPRPEPTLLVAETQTAGRGRLGRQWLSQRGDSLTFSLGMRLEPLDWSGLSLVVGISLAESLDEQLDEKRQSGQHIALKWPNDLWIGQPGLERKLGGILVETATLDGHRYVVIGVGINIGGATPSTAGIPPGYLQDLRPDLDAPAALRRVVPRLVQNIQAFAQFGFAPFQARFARRDVLAGRAVLLSDGLQGTAHGVSENGALLVHTSAGMKEITSSEVSVRPVQANSASTGQRPC